MSMEIKLVARSVELNDDQMKEVEREYKEKSGEEKSYAQIMKDEFLVSAGKAAGICYMPDNYFEKGIQDEEKAYKRGLNTLGSGHKTTGEHDHVSFIMKVPKIICILLNSIQIYNTSEKSSRYTKMKNIQEESSKSYELYHKWSIKFQKVIKNIHPDEYTDKEIEKLALENARYFLSIFNVESVMKYTVSYAECYMIIHYMNTLLDDIKDTEKYDKESIRFIIPLRKAVQEFLTEFKKVLGIEGDEEIIIPNNKNRYLYLLRFLKFGSDKRIPKSFKEYFGDVYNTQYTMSFAAFGQEQRHRTLKHRIEYPAIPEDGIDSKFYIPVILNHQTNSDYKEEWINDWNDLLNSTTDDVFQGEYITVTESGHFEDFLLKCKERLCSRAQIEICKQTAKTLFKFMIYQNNLSDLYIMELQRWFKNIYHDYYYGGYWPEAQDLFEKFATKGLMIGVKNRCKCRDFACKEVCKFSDIDPADRDI